MQWPAGGVVWRRWIGCDTDGDERVCWDGCAVVSVAGSDSGAQTVGPRRAGPVAWLASSIHGSFRRRRCCNVVWSVCVSGLGKIPALEA